MVKAILAIVALLAGAVTCLVGWWLGTAGLHWIATHREAVAMTQPWLALAILALVVLGTMQRGNQQRA